MTSHIFSNKIINEISKTTFINESLQCETIEKYCQDRRLFVELNILYQNVYEHFPFCLIIEGWKKISLELINLL